MSATGTMRASEASPGTHPAALRWLTSVPVYYAVLATLFLGAGLCSTRITEQMGGIAAVWLTNGLILAALFKAPGRRWAAIALTAFVTTAIADIAMGHKIVSACVYSAVDLIEVMIVAAPMRKLGLDRDIRDLRSFVTFVGLAFGPAITTSAALVATYRFVAHGTPFVDTGISWYMADALGLIQVAPAAMLIRREDLAALFKRDQLLPACASLFVIVLVFLVMGSFPQVPLGFLLFPCVLVLAFQQSYIGVAFGLMLTTAAVIVNMFVGKGFLASQHIPLEEKIFFLQSFVIVLTATMLVVTSILYEKKKVEMRLREATRLAITARNEALQARIDADRANSTKSQFLANMSHELRTPLNAILGFSEIIRSGGLATKCTGKCPEHADYIHTAGTHLLDLVNDVLDTSKIEAGKYDLHLERIDLANVARDAIGLVEYRAEESGVALTLEEPQSPVWLLADHRAVKQIALNLLSNAVKFTPSGGSVTVTVSGDADGAALSVKDTGIGIPADELPRLGRPFERVRSHAARAQPGTGLGLALVRSLAELHGGGMKIESEESIGTTVSVTLPANAESLAA